MYFQQEIKKPQIIHLGVSFIVFGFTLFLVFNNKLQEHVVT